MQHTLSTANGEKSLDKGAIKERIKTKLANAWTVLNIASRVLQRWGKNSRTQIVILRHTA